MNSAQRAIASFRFQVIWCILQAKEVLYDVGYMESPVAMNSDDIAQYIEQTDGLSQPWMLIQWRLQKLQERKADMEPDAYIQELAELHQALMKLGKWWVGREDEVF
ncbi:MAG: hypothetical protein AAF609_00415 [Cyanobacteria bacterium P01_C01_bin.120]